MKITKQFLQNSEFDYVNLSSLPITTIVQILAIQREIRTHQAKRNGIWCVIVFGCLDVT